ncbi:hypothetical protein MAFF211271_10070 [Ralstonia syzygii subsp. indonesiensis]|nr:hypothetical protein MAFF211271_10070 [Ralstonia pseudosolanacearum]
MFGASAVVVCTGGEPSPAAPGACWASAPQGIATAAAAHNAASRSNTLAVFPRSPAARRCRRLNNHMESNSYATECTY